MNWKQKSSSNPKLKSSIVHKPFSTGTVNFFHPYRQKSSSQLSTDEPSLDTELDLKAKSQSTSEEAVYSDRPWLNRLINPWSLGAIAMIFLANLVSGAVIWRNYRLSADRVKESESTLSSVDLTAEEFRPLNLGSLSMLETVEDTATKPKLTPIAPAQAPLENNLTASEYYYVLTEYAGDRSLALSRQKVKQVALVNLPQGIFIYLGAFTTKEQADRFVVQLLQENFTARVYPFD